MLRRPTFMKEIHNLREGQKAMERIAALDPSDRELSHLVGDILSDHDPIIDEATEDALVTLEACEADLTLQDIANGERIN